MIVRVKRQEFLKRLKIVEKVISENKIKPIISCTYLETKGDNLFFCGTNLETTITTETKVEEIIEEGRIVFQHQLVDEYLREIRDEEIVLSVRDNNLYIESSDSASEFSLMNPEDFPNIIENVESVKDKKNFKINSVELANILEKVKFAASTSSDNLSINCIRMENEGKKLKFATTDTYRLVFLEKEKLKFATTDTYRLVFLEKELDEIKGNVEVSIPLNTAEALTKLLKNMEEVEIVVYSTEKQIYFKIAETLMVSRVIDLVFPNYKGILGNDAYNKTLIVEIVVYSTEKQIYFKIAETLMVSRVIDLVFPNYKGILGNDAYNKTLIINNEVFLKVLRRIIIFVKNNAESKYGATFEIEGKLLKINGVNDIARINEQLEVEYEGEKIKISKYGATFEIEGKLLKINGVNDIARINEQLEVEYEGEKIKISLNAKFISEFIQNLDKDSDIILNFISPNSSVRIRQEGENNYLYVVMPLALKD